MKVRDNVELVHALGETQAVVVGHDWGAPIAWNSALLAARRVPGRRRSVGALGASG